MSKYYEIHCNTTGKRAVVCAGDSFTALQMARDALGWWMNAFGTECVGTVPLASKIFPVLQFSFKDSTGAGRRTFYHKTAAQAFEDMDEWVRETAEDCLTEYPLVAEVLVRGEMS